MKEYWNELSYREKVRFVSFGIIGLIVLLFTIFNWQLTELHLVVAKVRMPLTVIILVSMVGGYAFAKLSSFMKIRRLEKKIGKLEKKRTPVIEDAPKQVESKEGTTDSSQG